MDDAQNLFEELRAALQDFSNYIKSNKEQLKKAIKAFLAMIPKSERLIEQLVNVFEQLKVSINQINVDSIEGLKEATEFAGKLNNFLEATKPLIPDVTEEIDDVLETVKLITSMPSLEEIKSDITDLLGAIILDVKSLSPSPDAA